MKLYTDPAACRKMAHSLATYDPDMAASWLGKAAALEAGTTDAYLAAHDAWKAQEPRSQDYLPDDVREEIDRQHAEWQAALREQRDRIWGPLIRRWGNE